MKIKIFIFLSTMIANYLVDQSTVIEKDLLIKNDQVELPGTLSYTENSKDLIIWIHGSGNVDRNGNQVPSIKANYIKQFRDEINKNDIAFFSYDKRTSNPKNVAFLKGVTLDDFVSDAKKVIDYFEEKNQFKNIILVGHSQGSLIGMLSSSKVDKYISLAGPSETIDQTIVRQITGQSAEFGKLTEGYFKELKETGTIKEVNPNLLSIFAKPNFPFLRNWMAYNPVEEIKKVTIPTLIINGKSDLQVRILDAEELYKAKPNAKLILIDSMNHVLKTVKNQAENQSSYFSTDYAMSKELIEKITEFVKK